MLEETALLKKVVYIPIGTHAAHGEHSTSVHQWGHAVAGAESDGYGCVRFRVL